MLSVGQCLKVKECLRSHRKLGVNHSSLGDKTEAIKTELILLPI